MGQDHCQSHLMPEVLNTTTTTTTTTTTSPSTTESVDAGRQTTLVLSITLPVLAILVLLLLLGRTVLVTLANLKVCQVTCSGAKDVLVRLQTVLRLPSAPPVS